MLANKVRVNGRSIYRRGIGHVLKLMRYMEQIDPKRKGPDPVVVWVLKEFTDIRFPWLFVRFRRMEALAICENVIKVNVPKSAGSQTGSKTRDLEEIAVGIVDTLAAAYGWTMDTIMESVDLETYKTLAQAISNRKANEVIMAALVAHDPQQAIKRAQESCGIEEKSLAEMVKEAAKNGGKN